MTKAELIDRIARSRELPPDVTKKVIAQILDLAFSELASYFVRSRLTRNSSPRFSFPKFGTFTKKRRSGRRGVNPRTLEPMVIEACETVDFKPSAELKRQLNEGAGKKSKSKSKSTKTKTKKKPKKKAKKKPRKKKKAARSSSKRKAGGRLGKRAAGPGGRKLVTREEADLELGGEPLLPDAPLQRVGRKASRKRRGGVDDTGS